MKLVIFTTSSILFTLISCKENPKTNAVTTPNIENTYELEPDELLTTYDNSWVNEIKLNDGAKWQANTETNEGILKMLNTMKAKTTTLEAYYTLAAQLNEDKNFVVKNCTMKGASHDNLHIWLMPLIEKIKALSETKNLEDASKIKESIEENINGYATYFQ